MPKFCMIFATKMPKFYMIIAQKIFFRLILWGARAPSASRFLRLYSLWP